MSFRELGASPSRESGSRHRHGGSELRLHTVQEEGLTGTQWPPGYLVADLGKEQDMFA